LQLNFDTIAAIATAPGQGGIGVVRVSGRNASAIATVLLGRLPNARYATYSAFLDADGLVIDRGIALFFQAPNSYTGEDILELQAHGGPAVLHLLLRRCLSVGARMALPGEFTQRAFLNNKLDLVQAESVADLISATSEQAVRSANRSMDGEFSRIINGLVAELIRLRMLVEATLDFPEDELDQADIKKSKEMLASIRTDLERTLSTARQGSILRDGVHVVLAGQPNVGKSSLLNRLSGEDVALVSDIAGTTRDAIRQTITIEGVPLYIVDTAGLRESQDVVENMGIDRTKQTIQKADIVLVLMDARQEAYIEDRNIEELIPKSTPRLYVINKIDLIGQKERVETRDGATYIYISAKIDAGIDLLRSQILKHMGWHGDSAVFMARERHIQALTQAKQYLLSASNEVARTELFAEELRLAQDALSRVTGEFSSDDLLGEIFSRFCIGK
jgi:tRNA modification GTPase